MAVQAWQPLDAVISGFAYELATTALGVLEEGRGTKGRISTEMLCTLDNFIKVVLFNERIFFGGCPDLDKGDHFTVRHPRWAASDAGRRLVDQAGIFALEPKFDGNKEAVDARVNDVLGPLQHPMFIIDCNFPKRFITLLQEMVYLDPYLIEYSIEQFGAERFKPVFPGEHLYLGLRRQKVHVPQATYTMADVPGQRLRAVVREKMEQLNAFVAQGAPMLPALPPMFVARLLHDSPRGSDLVATLLEIRNSPAMKRFRGWMVKQAELSRSTVIADREKAAAALQKLQSFSPGADMSKMEFGKGLLKIAKSALKGDVVGIVAEVASPVVQYLAGIPLSGLRDFGGKKVGSGELDRFLVDNFGDKFNRHEMDEIAIMLGLPENLTAWGKEEKAVVTLRSGRLDNSPPLSRPHRVHIEDAAHVENARKDFEDLWNSGEQLTPELLRNLQEGKS
jgi:hypothetical protein